MDAAPPVRAASDPMADPTRPNARLLILDDDRVFTRALAQRLGRVGYDADIVESPDAAMKPLAGGRHDVLIVDLALPGIADPASWLRELRQAQPSLLTIVLTAYGSITTAVEATRLGVFDYLTKPVSDEVIHATLERAMRQRQLLREPSVAAAESGIGHGTVGGVVGRDPQMLRLFELVDAVADSRSTVLIVGESGTGKSMLARAIHGRSQRRERPFVELACGSLPETLLESELFGHVRGAFTGATADKRGRFAMADTGTIFLDEINSATPLMQVKLLRVLQERAFEPVGSGETRTVDARAILATNAELEPLVKAGAFRQDLFYRINVVTLRLPPLRERVGDIETLAGHFLERFCRESGRTILGFAPAAIRALERYPWPGNIRELENAVERAVLLCRRPRVEPDDLPETVATYEAPKLAIASATGDESPPMTLEQALEGPERRIIEAALRRNAWSRQATARELGIERTTLYKKMRKHGIGGRSSDAA